MEANPYEHFNADEFAVDPAFREWCLSNGKDDQAFWSGFLVRHPNKAEAVEQARQMVLGTDQYFTRQEASPRRVAHLYQQTLQAARQQQRTLSARRRYHHWRVAAVISLLIVSVAVIGYHALDRFNKPTQVAYRTEYGQQRTIQLPDGSIVRLNANSRLTLNELWTTDTPREVWLEGEAYFSVEKKPATRAKFVVHAQNLKVEVLGTQFNVSTQQEAVQVVLDEGQVKLSRSDATGSEAETITMAPGEMATLSDRTQNIIKQPVDTHQYSSWKDGYSIYEEATLAEVLDDVHQTFGYTVVVKDSLVLSETITGALSAENLDDLLVVLEDIIPNISLTKKQRQIIVDTKK